MGQRDTPVGGRQWFRCVQSCHPRAGCCGQGFEQPQAERILSLGKGGKAKKAHIKAIDRAYSDFRYYIVTKPKSKKPSPESHARVAVPKAKVAEAVELFAGMTREQIKALVDRALSQITFE